MPALNFQARFEPLVETGRKRQTVRAPRRDGRPNARVGDRLTLYTGMRSTACRKLGEAICSRAARFAVTEDHAIFVDGEQLADAEAEDAFARKDSFASAEEMLLWLMETHGLPFHGTLIEWRRT